MGGGKGGRCWGCSRCVPAWLCCSTIASSISSPLQRTATSSAAAATQPGSVRLACRGSQGQALATACNNSSRVIGVQSGKLYRQLRMQPVPISSNDGCFGGTAASVQRSSDRDAAVSRSPVDPAATAGALHRLHTASQHHRCLSDSGVLDRQGGEGWTEEETQNQETTRCRTAVPMVVHNLKTEKHAAAGVVSTEQPASQAPTCPDRQADLPGALQQA
jgi:hypothetical protein